MTTDEPTLDRWGGETTEDRIVSSLSRLEVTVGVLSFGFHYPPWVLGAGLALVWLAGLAVGPRGKVECRECRELRGVPGEINPAAYAHYMAEHYPGRARDGQDVETHGKVGA